MSETYRINEVFYSLQGEGVRAGTANLFLRFSGCNLACDVEPGPRSPGGFKCDTEFASGRPLTLDELMAHLREINDDCRSIIMTGGEPGLQIDCALIARLKQEGYYLAVETNGSVLLPDGLDWVTVSPKVAEHAIEQRHADEVKYVRGYGQAVPRTVVEAEHKLISPAFDGGVVEPRTLEWCMGLVRDNPDWRLSVQLHNLWKVR